MGEGRRLAFEEFEVGQRFANGSVTLTSEMVKTFAAAYDPQPFHLDETAAEASVFGGLAASGWHTAALTMRMLVDGGAPIDGGIIGVGGEIAWPRPTRPGDTLRVESEVVEIIPSRSKPMQGLVVMQAETFNQRDEVVQRLTAKLVVRRRTAP
ncbi:MaoC family dehydratase [Acuticoccus mangrovi]|uniref:MaoC family dehydratase n=1 Tax=Acuticoccus mangrovi TaxID=2796142 RepID=A0A934IL77_9HYPH|nr:MaoC family dehydratase [Acuticoccus mangrovi]MBJ3774680.1 MaoC family dehydratase [Acuticoccus mangrovi]